MPVPAHPSWLSRLATSGASARWPNRCAVCHAHTQGRDARVCRECVARFASPRLRCPRCALALGSAAACGACLRNPPPWLHAVTACDYGYPWDGLLAALKFHDALDLAPTLAMQLAEQVRKAGVSAVDAVLPVPLSAARLRERGYNQAALLARALAARLGTSFQPAWLLRLRDTPHQIALPRERRATNVRGAFAAEPLALAALRGRRIALVDDVMTTGSTLDEASRVLLAAGAAEVQVWVVARTPED
ncbi:ComF family protein [Methylibium sp.]|uniref:ComF family protein n=1 Tax=Methylibium sp. TaxID=2067992 RepID=UPI00286C2947|nr:ComF family protein [Methylibium sp.]